MTTAATIFWPAASISASLRVRALGCRTLDGSGMAVFQTVDAFRLFIGRAPDPSRMA